MDLLKLKTANELQEQIDRLKDILDMLDPAYFEWEGAWMAAYYSTIGGKAITPHKRVIPMTAESLEVLKRHYTEVLQAVQHDFDNL